MAWRLKSGQALHLGHRAGELVVIRGTLWLTRAGDPGDHFIEPGQRVYLVRGEKAVVEPAVHEEQVFLYWTPRPRSVTVTLVAPVLRIAGQAAALAAGMLGGLAKAASTVAGHARAWEAQAWEERQLKQAGGGSFTDAVEIVLRRT